MGDVALLPEGGGDINRRVDSQVRLPAPHPGGSVIGAHEACQYEREAMKRRFQRLAITRIENRKGRFWGLHDGTFAGFGLTPQQYATAVLGLLLMS